TDLLVVAGGDGSILRVVGQLGENIKPIFGINVGSLGFLTTASSSTYREAVECIARDRINFSQRALLEARVTLGDKRTNKMIAPICPHVLTNRSIIVADDSIIEIEASDPDYPVFLTLDGRRPIHVERESNVTIRKAKRTLPLASLPEASFFSVVRQKLKWSGSNV